MQNQGRQEVYCIITTRIVSKKFFLFFILAFLLGGAFMMLLANAPRSTDDVDIFWLEDKETLQQALRALRDAVQMVAQKNALEPNWLNYLTQLLVYDQITIPKGRLWRRYGPLHMYVPPKEYILVLKILAGREKDVEDLRILLPQTRVKTRQQARRLLERYVLPDARKQNAEQIANALDELFGNPEAAQEESEGSP